MGEALTWTRIIFKYAWYLIQHTAQSFKVIFEKFITWHNIWIGVSWSYVFTRIGPHLSIPDTVVFLYINRHSFLSLSPTVWKEQMPEKSIKEWLVIRVTKYIFSNWTEVMDTHANTSGFFFRANQEESYYQELLDSINGWVKPT